MNLGSVAMDTALWSVIVVSIVRIVLHETKTRRKHNSLVADSLREVDKLVNLERPNG